MFHTHPPRLRYLNLWFPLSMKLLGGCRTFKRWGIVGGLQAIGDVLGGGIEVLTPSIPFLSHLTVRQATLLYCAVPS